MANWSRYLTSGRIRGTLTLPPGSGLRQTWAVTLFGDTPPITDTTLTQVSEDFTQVGVNILVKDQIGPSVSLDSFVLGNSAVIVDTLATQTSKDFLEVSTGSVLYSSFGDSVDGVLVNVVKAGAMLSQGEITAYTLVFPTDSVVGALPLIPHIVPRAPAIEFPLSLEEQDTAIYAISLDYTFSNTEEPVLDRSGLQLTLSYSYKRSIVAKPIDLRSALYIEGDVDPDLIQVRPLDLRHILITGESVILETPVSILYQLLTDAVSVVITRVLDQRYSLDVLVLVEKPVDVRYVLQTLQRTECSLDILYEARALALWYTSLDINYAQRLRSWTYGVDVLYSLEVPPIQEKILPILYSQEVLQVIEINFKSAQTSAIWMTEMLALVNAERLAIGRTKMVEVYPGPGPDIATLHSNNMQDTGVYAHDSALFPVGYQTILERSQRLEHIHGRTSENIQLRLVNIFSDWTPLAAFTGWKNSPPHYANMMYDWPEESEPTMQMGLSYYAKAPIRKGEGQELLGPEYAGWFLTMFTQNFIDMRPLGGGKQMEREVNVKWRQSGALIEYYGMRYSTFAFKKVRASHTSVFAVRVEAQIVHPWAVRAAAQHIAPQYYRVHEQHGSDYGATIRVFSSLEGSYDVFLNARAAVQHEAIFGNSVSASLESLYGPSPRPAAALSSIYEGLAGVRATFSVGYADAAVIRTALSSGYEQTPVVRAVHNASYTSLPRVGASATHPYGFQSSVQAAHTASFTYQSLVRTSTSAPYSDEVRVRAQKADQYTLSLYNPVGSGLVGTYSIQGPGSAELTDLNAVAVVRINGTQVEHEGVDISTSEAEFVWVAKIGIADTSDYSATQIDDEVTVVMGGTAFNLILTSKTLNRDSPSGVTMDITAHSPTIGYSAPRAATVTYDHLVVKSARAICEEIVGASIQWDILDWDIPANYFGVENAEPISAVRTVVEAAGGILETTPSGVLVARYLFPVSVPDFAGAALFTLTDAEDNLSYGETISTTDVLNKFRIRDSSASISDTLEFTADEGSDDSGVIRAYVLPWRLVELRHTGGATVALSPLVLETRTEVEVVEITNGKGSLRFPAVGISSVVWKSTPLGAVVLDPRTSGISVPGNTINYGYGLVEVTYVVECFKASVQFPIGNTAQFILLTKE